MLLPDTDVMIDILRQFPPPALAWLESHNTEELALPGFVVLELIQGCRNKAEQERVEQVVARSQMVWPTEAAYDAVVHTYAQYHLSHNRGFIDALIGHTVAVLGQPLYTFNRKHYAVIAGLETRQPYSRTTTG